MRIAGLPRRMLCCLMGAALLAAPATAWAEEGKTMEDIPLELKKAYKNEGENNPLYTQRFGADPGVMEYEGRLYVYMTDDILELDAKGKITENSYSKIKCINCISSDDLVNWTDHGRIPVAGKTGIAKWAGNSWAPCAAHKVIDGKEKFFLYFCNGGNGIGVLTSDSPTGPWRDELGHLLITRKTPNCADVVWLFDPAVMVDEDGTGYLAFGGGVPEGKQGYPGTGRIVRLGEDMLSLDCDPLALNAPFLFEDSGLNKINGKYIYSYCSNWQTAGNAFRLTSGAIEYMTADEPLGPYKYAGELFPNQGKFFGLYGNNHHSIACLNGQYYLFYHNRSVEKARNLSGNYRSPQMDVLKVSEEGRLGPVTGTMKGVAQLKNLDPFVMVCGSTMANQAGMTVEVKDNRPCVKTKEGAWLKVSQADFREGARALKVNAGSASGCTLYVTLGSLKDAVAAEISIPGNTLDGVELTVPFPVSGVQDVYFIFDGEASFFSWMAE